MWLKLLTQVLEESNYDLIRTILHSIPNEILPNFDVPLLLADFLLGAFDQGHDFDTKVLALKSLFLLLTNHGLDCPKYYTKLYALLDARVEK